MTSFYSNKNSIFQYFLYCFNSLQYIQNVSFKFKPQISNIGQHRDKLGYFRNSQCIGIRLFAIAIYLLPRQTIKINVPEITDLLRFLPM